jgi:FkbM family methyltransferase
MLESYAQAGEDVIAQYYLDMSNIKKGKYLEIGVCYPIALSNTYRFYREGWRGTLVEPLPQCWPEIESVRPEDTLIKAACGTGSTKEVYVMSEDALSVTSKNHAQRLEREFKILISAVITVPVFPLSSFMEEKIDLVSIDVEGMELEVISTYDWINIRPSVVIIETREFGSNARFPEVNKFMVDHRYRVVADTGLNTIFCPIGYGW